MRQVRRIFILCLIGIIWLSSSGCHYYWRRYTSREYKVSILVPRFWRVVEPGRDLAIIVQAPLKGKGDRYQENVNVASKELPQAIDLETFFEVNKDQTLRTVPGAKLDISEAEMYAGRVRGKYLLFSARSPAVSVRVISGVWIKGKRLVLVTATSTIDDFPHYEETFKKILQSLRILD